MEIMKYIVVIAIGAGVDAVQPGHCGVQRRIPRHRPSVL